MFPLFDFLNNLLVYAVNSRLMQISTNLRCASSLELARAGHCTLGVMGLGGSSARLVCAGLSSQSSWLAQHTQHLLLH